MSDPHRDAAVRGHSGLNPEIQRRTAANPSFRDLAKHIVQIAKAAEHMEVKLAFMCNKGCH
eukprot:4157730-Amphidinium_carterae.1